MSEAKRRRKKPDQAEADPPPDPGTPETAQVPGFQDVMGGREATKGELLEMRLEPRPLKLPLVLGGAATHITIVPPVAASEYNAIWEAIEEQLERHRHPRRADCIEYVTTLPDEKGKPVRVSIVLSHEIAIRYVWLWKTAVLADGARLSYEEIVQIGERTGPMMPTLGLQALQWCRAAGQGIEQAKNASGEADRSSSPTTSLGSESGTEPGSSPGSEAQTTDESSPAPA